MKKKKKIKIIKKYKLKFQFNPERYYNYIYLQYILNFK